MSFESALSPSTWQPSPERQNRAREAHNNNFCQWANNSDQLVPSHAVEKGEAVSDLDVDLVAAEAPESVVDRLVHVFFTSC